MESITAYILAGGKSTRMGRDKATLALGETNFVMQIKKALSAANIENVFIVGHDKLDDGIISIPDIVPDKGPVGGIYTALKHSQTRKNFVLSVDVPLIQPAIIEWIMKESDLNALVTQVQVAGKVNPLIGIYDKELSAVIENHVKNEALKLMKIIEEIPHQTLIVPDVWAKYLQNINTPEEYKKIIGCK